MANLETFASSASFMLPMSKSQHRTGSNNISFKVPLADGTIAQGLMLRVTIPDYFSRISGSRAGWGHSWSQVEQVLEVANRKLAAELQVLVAIALEESLKPSRASWSSGRLEAAMLDPRNVVTTGRRFGVGNVRFLESLAGKQHGEVGKYWRRIDQGSTSQVGRKMLKGFWQDGGGRGHRPSGRRNSDAFVPLHGRPNTPGVGISMASKQNVARLSRAGVIQNPIEPHEYFSKAWAQFNPRSKALDALREAITQVLGISMKGVRRSWSATIQTMR